VPNGAHARTQAPPPAASPDVRTDVFKQSYTEVLLFLKHEDDKINRVLTALAFLTAAAVALYVFSAHEPASLDLKHSDLTAADFFFATFIIGLALAVLAAIAALDPTSFYPRFLGTHDEPESLLYYRAIGQDVLSAESRWREIGVEDGRGRWQAYGAAGEASLREALAHSYHLDARRLSHRAYHKVYRFTECNAFVNAAVMSLALLGISRLEFASASFQWWIIATMLVLYSWAPFYDYWVLVRQNFPDVGREYIEEPWRWQAFAFLLPLPLVSTYLLIRFTQYWPTLAFALAETVLVRLLSLHGRRWRVLSRRGLLVAQVAPAVVAAVGVCLIAWLYTW
jgi:hypothetical protein